MTEDTALLILVALIVLAVGGAALIARARRTVLVWPAAAALVYRDGTLERVLTPGRHDWFDPFGRRRAFSVGVLPVTTFNVTLTVMSRDQFSFRIALSCVLQVTDPQRYIEARLAQDPAYALRASVDIAIPVASDQLQPRLAAAAIERIAAMTLDDFLADPKAALAPVRAEAETGLIGLAIAELLVTEIVMPPEVRKMFTDVERARREGLAALERARAEQASLRALANAARALQANPALAQLRLVQAMETAKGAKTFILNAPAGGEADAATAATGQAAAPSPDA